MWGQRTKKGLQMWQMGTEKILRTFSPPYQFKGYQKHSSHT